MSSTYKFSERSRKQLETIVPNLQILFEHVIKHIDCIVLEGKRTEEQQRKNVAKGVSKTMNSKHVYPVDDYSLAVDVAPYPLVWPNTKSSTYQKDLARYYYFGGFVKAMFIHLQEQKLLPSEIYLRWGGDWDGDNIFIDQTFDDLVHFEIRLK